MCGCGTLILGIMPYSRLKKDKESVMAKRFRRLGAVVLGGFVVFAGSKSVVADPYSLDPLQNQINMSYDHGSLHQGDGGQFTVSLLSNYSASTLAVGNHSQTDSPGRTNIAGPYDSTNGGTAAQPQTGSALHTGDYFETFCVEHNEEFTPGNNYYFKVSDFASNGGITGGPLDPVDPATAYLYSKFRLGTLTRPAADGGGTYSTSADAYALQLAIWKIEGELNTDIVGGPNDNHTDYVGYTNNQLAQDWYNEATTIGRNSSTPGFSNNYGVQIMQLWTTYTPGVGNTVGVYSGWAQDQLTMTALPAGASTPLPPVALGSIALFGAMGIRKRFSRKHG